MFTLFRRFYFGTDTYRRINLQTTADFLRVYLSPFRDQTFPASPLLLPRSKSTLRRPRGTCCGGSKTRGCFLILTQRFVFLAEKLAQKSHTILHRTIDTHLFGFRRGLIPYRFEFGNCWTVLFEVIDCEEVASAWCINEK
jgi:hypothetical protein